MRRRPIFAMQRLRFAGWWRGFRAFPSSAVRHSPEERLQKATEARCKFRLPCLSAFLPPFSSGFSGGEKLVACFLKLVARISKSEPLIFSLLPCGVNALKISFHFFRHDNGLFPTFSRTAMTLAWQCPARVRPEGLQI